MKIINTIKNKIKKILYKNTIHDNTLSKQAIKKLLQKENPIIFEIGCADGLDTLEFLKTFSNPNFKIYCFEPDPRNIESFKRNINDKRVTLIEKAIGNIDGEMVFHQSSTIYSSSLKNPNIENIKSSWSDISFENEIKIGATTIDTFIKENNIDTVDFIWADVQGAEDLMIKGAENSLKNKIKYMYTEYAKIEYYKDSPTLPDILRSLGKEWAVLKDYKTDVLLKNKNI